jgi:hypothetical protein
MEEILSGGCQCGAVRFEALLEPGEGLPEGKFSAYYCHCRMCQRAFGNTRATFHNLPTAKVRFLGAPALYDSSRIALRGFCGRCGTPISFAYRGSDRMDLAVGAFDQPERFVPTNHVAVESRIASFHVPDSLPEKRLDEVDVLLDRFSELMGGSLLAPA